MPQLITFGSPRLDLGDRTVGAGKGVALLAFLMATTGHTAPRKELFRLLYSDESPRDADAFRQLLASLRRTLPLTFVATTDTIRLAEPIDTDRTRFLDAVVDGDDETAAQLYSREFFDDFSERGCDGFLRWAAEERTRLRRRFEAAAEAVVRRRLHCADWDAAIVMASSIAERFPQLTVGRRLLTESLTLAGRATEVRTTLVERLASVAAPTAPNSDEVPDSSIDAVLTFAREHHLADPTRPIIGRANEFRVLVDAWQGVQRSSGTTVLIDGPAGIGRTRLLANLALRLRLDTPAVILDGVASTDAEESGSVVDRLIAATRLLRGAEPMPATPVHGDAVLDSTDLPQGVASPRLAPIDQLVDALRAASLVAPVAVLLDDIDRADATTIRIVAAATARLHLHRVLFVIASTESLATQVDTPAANRITLRPLDVTEVQQLCGAAGSTDADATAPAIFAKTGGVPSRLMPLIARSEAERVTPTSNVASPASTIAPSAARRAAFATWSPTRVLARVARSGRAIPLLTAVAALSLVVLLAIWRNKSIAQVPNDSVAETLVIQSYSDDSVYSQFVDIRNPSRGTSLPMFSVRNGVAHWPLQRAPDRVSLSPDGRTIAAQVETGSRNTMDIVGVQGDRTVDLAAGERDDAMPAWSSDGAMLAFSTTRWSELGNAGCDIGVRDVRSRDIWRVTEGPDCDLFPTWSPSGRSIAFLRQSRERGDRAALCVLADMKGEPRCTPVDSGMVVQSLIGWVSDENVLLIANIGARNGIYSVGVTSGRSHALIDGLTVAEAVLSPSRAYVACWCSDSAGLAQSVTLLDIAQAQRPLQLDAPTSAPLRHLAWASPNGRAAVNSDSLRGRLVLQDRFVSEASRVRLAALANRHSTGNAATQFTLDDRPPQPSPPYTDPRTLFSATSHSANDKLLLTERWERIDPSQWMDFGEPRPRASLELGGLDPAGDGSYPSGLHTRTPLRIDDGLTVEALVRVPVTQPVWQEVGIYLESAEFTRAIAKWNHSTGTWPSSNPFAFFSTGMKYPAREGRARTTSLAISSGGSITYASVDSSIGDGRDVLLSLTLLRDSTMVVAVNGTPIGTRRYTPAPSGEYHLFIMGHSVESAVRVRAVRVWTHPDVRGRAPELRVGVRRAPD